MFGPVPTILQWTHHRLAQFYPSTILVDILIGFMETKPLPVDSHDITAMYFTASLNCSQGLHTANGSLLYARYGLLHASGQNLAVGTMQLKSAVGLVT